VELWGIFVGAWDFGHVGNSKFRLSSSLDRDVVTSWMPEGELLSCIRENFDL
jgi:hypothetical protein